MRDSTPQTNRKMLHGLRTPPPSPEVARESTLRSRLQQLLDELPRDLPTYYHEQLLNEVCFLLQSPLFLFAISPRLRSMELSSESPAAGIIIPQSLHEGKICDNIYRGTEAESDAKKLGIEIKWDDDSWVTRLLYGESTLIEGREYNATEESGFAQSFHWFCEEATFLCCEFRAREHAAAVSSGSAVDGGPMETNGVQTRAAAGDKKKRRLVKLKIRLNTARGRSVRVMRRRR